MNLERIYEKRRHVDRKENAAGIAMAIIPVLGFLIFGLVPMVLGIAMSFFHFDFGAYFFKRYTSHDLNKVPGTWNFEFYGFKNYEKLFTLKYIRSNDKGNGGKFWASFVTTVCMYLSVPACIIVSLLVAFFLSKKLKGRDILRTVYLMPFICSSVAIALIWAQFFSGPSQGAGIFNQIRNILSGGKTKDIFWTRTYFYECVFVANLWGGTGFNIILFTAALTNVNNSYYEAARVDGANAFQVFFKITLPAISPTTFYLFITSTIGALQAYATPAMIAKIGGTEPMVKFGVNVQNPDLTVIAYINDLLTGSGVTDPGLACAMGVLLAVIIGIITIFNFIGSKLWVSYD